MGKKTGKLRFDFNQHIGTNENTMITSVITTSVNESDMNYLVDVVELAALLDDAWLMADKEYKNKKE